MESFVICSKARNISRIFGCLYALLRLAWGFYSNVQVAANGAPAKGAAAAAAPAAAPADAAAAPAAAPAEGEFFPFWQSVNMPPAPHPLVSVWFEHLTHACIQHTCTHHGHILFYACKHTCNCTCMYINAHIHTHTYIQLLPRQPKVVQLLPRQHRPEATSWRVFMRQSGDGAVSRNTVKTRVGSRGVAGPGNMPQRLESPEALYRLLQPAPMCRMWMNLFFFTPVLASFAPRAVILFAFHPLLTGIIHAIPWLHSTNAHTPKMQPHWNTEQ